MNLNEISINTRILVNLVQDWNYWGTREFCIESLGSISLGVSMDISTNLLTPWLVELAGSMPHSQGLSNNSYPEPNEPNYPHCIYTTFNHISQILYVTELFIPCLRYYGVYSIN